MRNNKKKVLVTGGGGYIGSHAIKALLLEGFSVVVFDNFYRGFTEPLHALKKYGELAVVKGDLMRAQDIEKVFKSHAIDCVMHFAALCLVDESMRMPEIYFENNVVGTLNLLESMKKHNIKKIIFSSTCAVYGETQYVPVDENHPTNPTNPYGQSKLMAEHMIEWFGKVYGISYVIFRYFNICGADSDGEIGDSKKPSELLVQNAVRGALGIEKFQLTCGLVNTKDKTPIRDYVDVEDLARVHVQAEKYLSLKKPSVILNLGNGTGWSVKEILKTVSIELGKPIKINLGKKRKGEYAKIFADTKKAKQVLNFKTTKTLPESIISLKKWYMRKPHGYKK